MDSNSMLPVCVKTKIKQVHLFMVIIFKLINNHKLKTKQ